MIVVEPDFVKADGAEASARFIKENQIADNSTPQSLVGSTAFPPYPFSREFSAVHIS